MSRIASRRRVLAALASAGAGGLAWALVPWARVSEGFRDGGERLSLASQRLLLRQRPLVREFGSAEISRHFPVNGTGHPAGDHYAELARGKFRSWQLRIGGLVRQPYACSLEQLRRWPARSQVTLHNCDEGWNAIAQWRGVPLAALLQRAQLLPQARYVVFHCLDRRADDGNFYYESIDLFDAFHPQTILAYEMNGQPLPIEYGAPLRLRVELQIGYKNAKYVDRIEVVDRLDTLGKGRGGWWEDFDGAVWYAAQ